MEDKVQLSDETKKRMGRRIEYIKSPDFRNIYSSSATFGISFYDLRINFGQVVDADSERVLVENSISVAMSPQHAKALLGALEKNVKKYEDEYGKIRVLDIDEDEEDENQPAK